MTNSPASCWKEHATHPEFVAVIILLSTEDGGGGGDGLYPLTVSSTAVVQGGGDTSSSTMSQQQEVVGISLLDRLLRALAASGVVETVLAVAEEQQYRALRTQLLADGRYQVVSKGGGGGKKDDKGKATDKEQQPLVLESTTSPSSGSRMKLTVMRLTAGGDDDDDEEAAGSSSSWDALRQIEEAQIVPADSHLVVVPGDLVVLQAESLKQLMDRHRRGSGPQKQRWMAVNPTPQQQQQQQQQHGDTATRKALPPPVACTVLLADVAEVDEHGNPLKESAKQKKGLLARDEEEIDYMAVTAADHRLVWKQPKLDVEEDKDMVGSTPKLVLPKARLRGSGSGVVRVSTEWNDVHCYCLAPWVRRLVTARSSASSGRRRIQSIQEDLVPLLIARQFRGVAATFGSRVETEVVDEVLRTHPHLRRCRGGKAHPESNLPSVPLRSSNVADVSAASANQRSETTTADDCHDDEYAVLAHIVSDKSVFRSHTINAYLYANREVAHQVSAIAAVHHTSSDQKAPPNPCLALPEGASVKPKFHSVLLPGTTVGDKVTFKSSVVGRNCQLGAKCRLNNVVLQDNVTLGDNIILQNTVVGHHATLAENCNLNDCQVAPGMSLPAGTKQKGEAFVNDNNDGQDEIADPVL